MTDITITRLNEVVFSGLFVAADGSGAQPSNAEAVVTYLDLSGESQTANVVLANAGGTWSGVWDSSPAQAGCVDYTVHCWGGVVAAQDGKINIKANKSNLTIA